VYKFQKKIIQNKWLVKVLEDLFKFI